MKLTDFKIGTRLYLGYGTIVLILAALVAIAYLNISRLSAANDINIHTYAVIDRVDGALSSLVDIETGQRGFALTGNPASLEPYHAGKANFSKQVGAAIELTADNAVQQERLKRLVAEQERWMNAAVDPVIALRKATPDEEFQAVIALVKEGKGKRGMDAMRVMVSEIVKEERMLLDQRSGLALALRQQTSAWLVGGGILAAILAMLIAYASNRTITGPLRAAVDLAQRVADGDLTVTVDSHSKDEVGELLAALKAMNTSLNGIVRDVRGGTDAIATASAEISAGNMDLSSRTEQQASALEETASSMEELTSTVRQNADNARQANQLAATASEVATRGGTAVSQVVDTMGAINESARRIVDIIGVIDGIAFQTNILALNAAVEAARAGEQGRGFAVVASEVRSLAQRSAAAAKEIKGLIDSSVEKVDLGTRLVDQAGVTMEEVVSSVRRVNDIISEIASASAEQQAGIEQVNQAIVQMDHVTQQNAALVEEAAAAAAAMQEQAVELAQTVSVFKTDDQAQAPVQTAARAPAARPARPASRAKPVARHPASTLAVAPPAPKTGARKAVAAAEEEWEQF